MTGAAKAHQLRRNVSETKIVSADNLPLVGPQSNVRSVAETLAKSIPANSIYSAALAA